MSPARAGRAVRRLLRFDVRRRIGEIELPTHVVVGRRDVLTPPRMAQAIAERHRRGAACRCWPGCGHMVMLERAERARTTLLDGALAARSGWPTAPDWPAAHDPAGRCRRRGAAEPLGELCESRPPRCVGCTRCRWPSAHPGGLRGRRPAGRPHVRGRGARAATRTWPASPSSAGRASCSTGSWPRSSACDRTQLLHRERREVPAAATTATRGPTRSRPAAPTSSAQVELIDPRGRGHPRQLRHPAPAGDDRGHPPAAGPGLPVPDGATSCPPTTRPPPCAPAGEVVAEMRADLVRAKRLLAAGPGERRGAGRRRSAAASAAADTGRWPRPWPASPARATCVLLVGGLGAGKTTFAQGFAARPRGREAR